MIIKVTLPTTYDYHSLQPCNLYFEVKEKKDLTRALLLKGIKEREGEFVGGNTLSILRASAYRVTLPTVTNSNGAYKVTSVIDILGLKFEAQWEIIKIYDKVYGD